MHINVTDATFKLLERKSYEVQERPKMTINGNVSIATYFILNKKDRTGKVAPRPFHAVLEEMKKQETEKAKMKQSSSLKGTNAGTPGTTVTENGNHLAPPALVVPQVPAVPINERPPAPAVVPLPAVEVPAPTVAPPPLPPPPSKVLVEEANEDSTSKLQSTTDGSLKTFEVITDRPTTFNRASRSKTCILL